MDVQKMLLSQPQLPLCCQSHYQVSPLLWLLSLKVCCDLGVAECIVLLCFEA